MADIVAEANKAFSKAMYCKYENGVQPRDAKKIALTKALGVSYQRISLPIDKVPKDSKFFLHPVNQQLTSL